MGTSRSESGSVSRFPSAKQYKLQPRHARLAINAAYRVATFVLEILDARSASGAPLSPT